MGYATDAIAGSTLTTTTAQDATDIVGSGAVAEVASLRLAPVTTRINQVALLVFSGCIGPSAANGHVVASYMLDAGAWVPVNMSMCLAAFGQDAGFVIPVVIPSPGAHVVRLGLNEYAGAAWILHGTFATTTFSSVVLA